MTASSVRSSQNQVRRFPFAQVVDRLLPLVGVLVLFGVWWLIAVSGLINPVLLPTPIATLGTLITGMLTGTMLPDFFATVLRTFSAFLMAAVVGVPVGVALGSSEKLYRSMVGDVLADNHKMLSLMSRLGFAVMPHPDGNELKRVVKPLRE